MATIFISQVTSWKGKGPYFINICLKHLNKQLKTIWSIIL